MWDEAPLQLRSNGNDISSRHDSVHKIASDWRQTDSTQDEPERVHCGEVYISSNLQ